MPKLTDQTVSDLRGAVWSAWAWDYLLGLSKKQKHRGLLAEWINDVPVGDLSCVRFPDEPDVYLKEGEKPLEDSGGLMKIGWGSYKWKYDHDVADYALRTAPLVDTAPGYGFGRVEVELGKVIAGIPTQRRTAKIATKVSRNHMSKQATRNAIDRSLKRLGVERIDLYQIHWPSSTVPIGDTLEPIAQAVIAGKIDKVGVCNFNVFLLQEAIEVASSLGVSITSNQIPISRSNRDFLVYTAPWCATQGITVIAHSPFDQKVRKTGNTPQSTLSWLSDTGIDYAIPGTNSVDHLAANLSLND